MLSITIYSNGHETTRTKTMVSVKPLRPLNEWIPYNYKTDPLLHENV